MPKRGRPSSASLLTFPDVTGMPPRLTPPAFLPTDEAALFAEIVNGCDPRHFVDSDLPLIVSYVKASLLARDAPNDLCDEEALGAWEKAVRVQAMLATKLRLSPQTRLDPETVKRREERQGLQTWEIPRQR